MLYWKADSLWWGESWLYQEVAIQKPSFRLMPMSRAQLQHKIYWRSAAKLKTVVERRESITHFYLGQQRRMEKEKLRFWGGDKRIHERQPDVSPVGLHQWAKMEEKWKIRNKRKKLRLGSSAALLSLPCQKTFSGQFMLFDLFSWFNLAWCHMVSRRTSSVAKDAVQVCALVTTAGSAVVHSRKRQMTKKFSARHGRFIKYVPDSHV